MSSHRINPYGNNPLGPLGIGAGQEQESPELTDKLASITNYDDLLRASEREIALRAELARVTAERDELKARIAEAPVIRVPRGFTVSWQPVMPLGESARFDLQPMEGEQPGDSFTIIEQFNDRVTETVYSLREKAIRDALIALGWTPPEVKP